MSHNKKISNWLLFEEKPHPTPQLPPSKTISVPLGRGLDPSSFYHFHHRPISNGGGNIVHRKLAKFDENKVTSSSSKLLKSTLRHVEEKELTRSPISGTYIIKEWNGNKTASAQHKDRVGKVIGGFSKNEVALNSIAASFVDITPQARARLEKIPNRIGPYECKLCKVIYKDAFELAMHNCPRVIHMEYKCVCYFLIINYFCCGREFTKFTKIF